MLTAAAAVSPPWRGRSRTLRAKLAVTGTYVHCSVGNRLPLRGASKHRHDAGPVLGPVPGRAADR